MSAERCRHGVPLAEIQRQVDATQARPLWHIPASWWDDEAAANMAAWIKRFGPSDA